jgi:hypothetical protein
MPATTIPASQFDSIPDTIEAFRAYPPPTPSVLVYPR